jgi:hypothetical protein
LKEVWYRKKKRDGKFAKFCNGVELASDEEPWWSSLQGLVFGAISARKWRRS